VRKRQRKYAPKPISQTVLSHHNTTQKKVICNLKTPSGKRSTTTVSQVGRASGPGKNFERM
jgi:hypothetical protein